MSEPDHDAIAEAERNAPTFWPTADEAEQLLVCPRCFSRTTGIHPKENCPECGLLMIPANTFGPTGAGTPAARMRWFWEILRKNLDDDLLMELVPEWSPVSSRITYEDAIARAFVKLTKLYETVTHEVGIAERAELVSKRLASESWEQSREPITTAIHLTRTKEN